MGWQSTAGSRLLRPTRSALGSAPWASASHSASAARRPRRARCKLQQRSCHRCARRCRTHAARWSSRRRLQAWAQRVGWASWGQAVATSSRAPVSAATQSSPTGVVQGKAPAAGAQGVVRLRALKSKEYSGTACTALPSRSSSICEEAGRRPRSRQRPHGRACRRSCCAGRAAMPRLPTRLHHSHHLTRHPSLEAHTPRVAPAGEGARWQRGVMSGGLGHAAVRHWHPQQTPSALTTRGSRSSHRRGRPCRGWAAA